MNYISLQADWDAGEGKIKVSNKFYELGKVEKIDFLQDWMSDLEALKKIAMEECYKKFDREKVSDEN